MPAALLGFYQRSFPVLRGECSNWKLSKLPVFPMIMITFDFLSALIICFCSVFVRSINHKLLTASSFLDKRVGLCLVVRLNAVLCSYENDLFVHNPCHLFHFFRLLCIGCCCPAEAEMIIYSVSCQSYRKYIVYPAITTTFLNFVCVYFSTNVCSWVWVHCWSRVNFSSGRQLTFHCFLCL